MQTVVHRPCRLFRVYTKLRAHSNFELTAGIIRNQISLSIFPTSVCQWLFSLSLSSAHTWPLSLCLGVKVKTTTVSDSTLWVYNGVTRHVFVPFFTSLHQRDKQWPYLLRLCTWGGSWSRLSYYWPALLDTYLRFLQFNLLCNGYSPFPLPTAPHCTSSMLS